VLAAAASGGASAQDMLRYVAAKKKCHGRHAVGMTDVVFGAIFW